MKYLSFTLLFFFQLNLCFAQKPELTFQLGHSDRISSISYSPDGKFIVSGSRDKTIKLWEVSTGKELHTFTGHKADINTVVFSPDGKYIASCSWENTIVIFDVFTGEIIWHSEVLEGMIRAITYSPDSKFLAFGIGKKITLWEVSKAKQFDTYIDSGLVHSIAFSPDGKNISSSSFGSINSWEVSTGKQLKPFSGFTNWVNSISYSPNGKLLVAGSYDGVVKIWDTKNNVIFKTFNISNDQVKTVAFTSDGMHIMCVTYDKSFRLLDISKEVVVQNFNIPANWANSVSFSPNGKYIAATNYWGDKSIQVWEISTGLNVKTITGHGNEVTKVSFSQNNKFLASQSDERIRLWNFSNSKEIKTLITLNDKINCFDISPDCNYLARNWNNTIKIFDVVNNKVVKTIRDLGGSISLIAYSTEGKYLATSNRNSIIKLWDINSEVELRSFVGHKNSINSVTFSSNGKYMATGSEDSTVKLWELNSGKELNSLIDLEDKVRSVIFSNDGKYIAGSSWGKIMLWEVITGLKLKTIFVKGGPTSSVAFSPDGKFIAYGSLNNINLLEMSNLQEEKTIKYDGVKINSISFSPDSKYFATGANDGKIKLWNTISRTEIVSLIGLDTIDWVIASPVGFFDASQNGVNQIHYLQGLDTIPLESFFEDFYRPGLLASVFKGEEIKKSILNLDFSNGVKLPPIVKINSPSHGDSLKSNETIVQIETYEKGGGIDEIKLFHNGKAIVEFKKGFEIEVPIYSFKIVLDTGINEIKVTAFSRDRIESVPDVIRIYNNIESQNPNLYILSIGIDKYENENYLLHYCESDAKEVEKKVKKKAKGLFKNIYTKVILSARAKRDNILSELNELILKVKENDVFIFHYSGHGVSSDGNFERKPDFFLVLQDVQKMFGTDEELISKGISGRELIDIFIKIKARKQLILLDCCRSGTMINQFVSKGGDEEGAISQLQKSTGVYLLAASGADQTAKENNDIKHGFFTYAFLQALDCDSGINYNSGKIEIEPLNKYVFDKVVELTKKYNTTIQRPLYWSKKEYDFPIGMCGY